METGCARGADGGCLDERPRFESRAFILLFLLSGTGALPRLSTPVCPPPVLRDSVIRRTGCAWECPSFTLPLSLMSLIARL